VADAPDLLLDLYYFCRLFSVTRVKKILSVGLFALLAYHTLATVLVAVGAWWQAERDLSEQLVVYRTVDSLVEFEIPLANQVDSRKLSRITEGGFSYRGSYYDVVSVETRADKLFVIAMGAPKGLFWSDDLLSFLENNITGASESHQKGSQLLKLLLKEYPPVSRLAFTFHSPGRGETVRIPGGLFVLSARALPVHSPPPRA